VDSNPKRKYDETNRTPLHVVDEKNNQTHLPTKRRKRKMSRYIKYMFGTIAAYIVFSFLVGGYQIWQVKGEIKQLKDRQNILIKQQTNLEKELKSLQDPEMIEKLARESLGMVKPGETLVVPALPGKNIPKPKNVKVEEIQD
jgi:cell division protein FtsB